MLSFKKFFFESKEKHAVVFLARMNPPNTGHELNIQHLHKVAKEHGADHLMVVSHAQDKKKNPLSPDDKLKHLKRAFPDTNMTLLGKGRSIHHHFDDLAAKGYTHVHFIAGSDRVPEYKSLTKEYMSRNPDKFKKINVIKGNERTSDNPEQKVSSTDLRNFVQKGDYKSFSKYVPSKIRANKEHTQELYNDTKKGMGL